MNTDNKELLFGKKLNELKKLALANNKRISSGDVEELFGELELSKSQLDLVYDYIKKQGYSLTEDKNPDIPLLTGDIGSLTALTEAFLPNINEFARLYQGQGVLPEDLTGEGNLAVFEAIALLEGAPANDDERSAFEAYLARAAMSAMERAVNENLSQKDVESLVLAKVKKVGEAAGELSDLLRRKVTINELLNESEDLNEDEIRAAIKLSGGTLDVEE